MPIRKEIKGKKITDILRVVIKEIENGDYEQAILDLNYVEGRLEGKKQIHELIDE